MSFNKNNPNAMGKIMGYLKQLSTEMGATEPNRGQSDEERLYRPRGHKYSRVPSRATLSNSTTCTSLATTCGSQGTLAPNYAAIPEHISTETSSEDEQDSFDKTRRHFQQLRQISLGNEFKYKMEMEIKGVKEENLRNSVPYVNQLSTDSNKVKTEYSINNDGSPYSPTTHQSNRKFLWTQVLAAFAVSMGSLIVGFSSGYTSPGLPSMNKTLPLTTEDETWIGGLMPLGALMGGIIGGTLIEFMGRGRTIMAISVPFFLAFMLIANATNTYMIFVGRALSGIAVGVGTLAFPVYIGETVHPDVRGALGLLPTAFGNVGILLSFLVGTYLDWSQLAFFGAALPIPFFLLMLLTPETPRWYAIKGRHNDARKSLQWLRGKSENVDKELRDLTKTQEDSDRNKGNVIGQIFTPRYMPAVCISLTLMLFQQLSGINAIIFYAKDIFKMSGSAIDPNLSSIIIGLVNFMSTFVAAVIIDKLGRKMLLYISSLTMIVTLLALGTYYYLKEQEIIVNTFGWIPLVSLVIYVIGFSIGFGPIPWLMLGEILPTKIRGTAAALATGFNWTCTFIVTKTFKSIIEVINMSGTIWLFSAIVFIALFFVIFFVPETRGKSLDEIEQILTGSSRKRKMNNKNVINQC